MTSPAIPILELTWPDAQAAVLDGKKVRRASWVDTNVVVFLTDGFLKIRHGNGKLDALLVSEADMQATDWVVVREH